MGSFYFALGLDTLFGPFDALDFMINSPYCRHHLSNDLAVRKWCLIKHYSLNDIFLSSDLFTGFCCTDVEEVYFFPCWDLCIVLINFESKAHGVF